VQILNVQLGHFFDETKHILVLGSTGAGKTSTLLLLCYLFNHNGETILWRDDTSTEWLSLVDTFPWRVFVPIGCEFCYKHPNVEYIYYDPFDLHTLFNEIKRGAVHAIEFDPFVFETSAFIGFWSRFFYELYRWKGPDARSKLAFFTDELNDLAAGAKRGYVPRQLQLASNIYLAQKKYRKEKIRLVSCYDAGTRVLTQEGMKTYNLLKIGDKVLSVNPQTKDIEWKPVVNIYEYNYEGKMIHFKGKSFDVLVTPNHKMLLLDQSRPYKWQNLKFEEASKTSKRAIFRFPQGTWAEQKFPDLTNDFFYLLGLYVGDGSIYSEIKEPTKSGLRRKDYLGVRDGVGRFCQHGSPATLSYHRPRVTLFIPPEDKSRKKVEDALTRMNIHWHNDHHKNLYFDTASSKKFEEILSECGSYAEEKHIPRKWLDGASTEQLNSLFEGLIDSDGNAHSYTTVSGELAVDFVELVTKLGWSATIKTLPGKDVFIKDHIAHSKQYCVISVHFRPKYKPFGNIPQEEDYSGVVWCPEVADNHNLLVERNGRFVFCGNSTHGYGDLHKPVREGFQFYIFKQMHAGQIPDDFKRYEKVIERLAINEAIIVDEARGFNKITIDELVKPKRISVRWKGVVKEISKKKTDELTQWKTKIAMLAEVMHASFEVPYKDISRFLGYAEQSGLANLMKKYKTSELVPQIETFVEQLKQLEKGAES